jgi:formylglycine-generating enzyme required for sulfatase activity
MKRSAIAFTLVALLGSGSFAQDQKTRERREYGRGNLAVKDPAEFTTEGKQIKTTLPPTITNSIGMKLKLIPAGEFLMGSPASETVGPLVTTGDLTEEQQHRVQITRAYYLGTTEVTQGQWEGVMGTTPWKGKTYVKEGSDYAASYVSWDDAVEFCRRLSAKDGRTYRLPTEAEWEYACRAKSTSVYSFGASPGSLKDYAWFNENAYDVDAKYAHRVGQKLPNAFGLFDMHGNVYEWCSDWYGEDYYATSPGSDPTGPRSGSGRVIRGGSWSGIPRHCRSAIRHRITPIGRSSNIGFRVSSSVPAEPVK